mgnify:CR=1 FL=1
MFYSQWPFEKKALTLVRAFFLLLAHYNRVCKGAYLSINEINN